MIINMKTLLFTSILFLLFSIRVEAQNCNQDADFIKSCVIESRIFKPGKKIGFLEDCTKNVSNKLWSDRKENGEFEMIWNYGTIEMSWVSHIKYY